MSALTSYRQLFLLPGAGRFFVPAALARLGVSMQGLAILWAVHGASGSFAVAGLVSGAFAIAEAVLAPQVARFVDSHGQRAVATAQLPVFALASSLLILAVSRDQEAWMWILASAVAGVSCPQIGSLAAARWRQLTGGSAQVSSALALEVAVNEITFMLGPVLVTTLSAAAHPSAGLVLSAVLVLLFATMLVTCRDSEPPRQPRGPGLVLDARLVRSTFLPFVVLHLLLGLYFGGMALCLTAAALSCGAGAFAGLIAAGGGAASLLTGLLHGASPRLGAAPAMIGGSALLAVTCLALGLTQGFVPLVLLTVLAGACIAPIVIPAAVTLQQETPRSLYVQAVTWTGSASALGSAVAGPLVGRLVDQVSPQAGYLALAIVVGGLTLTTAAFPRARR
ncbi:MFS transporter [Brachybacterium sp. AOP43-C2-M15]|uniref:MFS transporter n=1 Tax=Brachybacterium sp. AOP43-C2-M15 TaxID=3457661 RepID=UPI004034ABAB